LTEMLCEPGYGGVHRDEGGQALFGVDLVEPEGAFDAGHDQVEGVELCVGAVLGDWEGFQSLHPVPLLLFGLLMREVLRMLILGVLLVSEAFLELLKDYLLDGREWLVFLLHVHI